MNFLKKLFTRISRLCAWFKFYPSLSTLLIVAKEKKMKLIKISPRITVYEFLCGANYIIEGVVEISAENIGSYVMLCYEELVKYYDSGDVSYKKCESAVLKAVEEIRKRVITEGFDVYTTKLKVV